MWELNTAKTKRSVMLEVDRDTMQPIPRPGGHSADPSLDSNDDMGDPAATALIGPLIDIQASVFLMRRLPLAVGYKTTLTSLPFAVGQATPKKLDLAVTGIEAVNAPTGKYNCYKVVFGAIGQTFWFSADASRKLVKFQSGNVVAEEAAMWVGEDLAQVALAPFKAAGLTVIPHASRGHYTDGEVCMSNNCSISVEATKVYTPSADIPQSLQQAFQRELRARSEEFSGNVRVPGTFDVRGNGVQTLLIGGQQALGCLADRAVDGPDHMKTTYYIVWIQTENTLLKVTTRFVSDIAVWRWRVDQILSAVKLP